MHLIRVPVLLVTATDDMIKPYVAEPFFWGVEKVKWVNLENVSHLPFWEDRESYVELVGKWLDGFNLQK